MCSGLQCDETPRYLSKCLFYRFRCRRHFLFQNDFSCFIQNTVERPAISQIHTDRQLLFLENFVTKYLHSANLLHCRSPFLCLEHVFHRERIASRWRPAFSSHLINAEIGQVPIPGSTCPVRRVVSMGRRNTCLQFTRRSLKT